jgi:YD repeat-containing protein
MRLGEILDGSFNLYRRHFGLFMRLSLILVWLPTAAGIYLNLRFTNSPFELINLLELHVARSIGIFLLFLVVWSACSLLLKAGTIRVISDSYLGREPELGASLRFGVEKIIPLLLVAISKTLLLVVLYVAAGLTVVLLYFVGRMISPALGALMIFAGAIAACWLVTWILCAYAMTTPIVVLEDLTSSFDAFGRSWELTRDARGKVFGTVAVTWLISQFLPQVVVQGLGNALGVAGNQSMQPVFVVVASLLGIVLAPILPCALTLLYYDLRVRREAFDIQVLSEQLGTGIH